MRSQPPPVRSIEPRRDRSLPLIRNAHDENDLTLLAGASSMSCVSEPMLLPRGELAFEGSPSSHNRIRQITRPADEVLPVAGVAGSVRCSQEAVMGQNLVPAVMTPSLQSLKMMCWPNPGSSGR